VDGDGEGVQSESLSSVLTVKSLSMISGLGEMRTESWDLEEVAEEEMTLTCRELEDWAWLPEIPARGRGVETETGE